MYANRISKTHGVPCRSRSNQSFGAIPTAPPITHFIFPIKWGSGKNGARPSVPHNTMMSHQLFTICTIPVMTEFAPDWGFSLAFLWVPKPHYCFQKVTVYLFRTQLWSILYIRLLSCTLAEIRLQPTAWRPWHFFRPFYNRHKWVLKHRAVQYAL